MTEDGKVAARAYYKSKGLSGYAFPNVMYVGELSYARSNLREAVLPYGLKPSATVLFIIATCSPRYRYR